MSAGRVIEIQKEIGSPRRFVERFGLDKLEGTHALGHTRMATESRVMTEASHPFSTGLDLCLVHNGSLSNHNRLRRVLRREGIEFETDNDTEVAAGYLAWRLREGASLTEALEGCLKDLDGFYTFLVGTVDGFAVMRDPIACKPAVIAESEEWVAMASEYRAIAVLPGAAEARSWEPEPGVVYAWEREARLMAIEAVGATGVEVVDLAAGSVRELNQRLHDIARDGSGPRRFRVLNPRGAHGIACGLDVAVEVEIDGHVGYYCAGMNKLATVRVRGNAGVGVAENLMSGLVVVEGNASQSAGATGRGGALVVHGDATARCGISMKGIDIVVRGSVGHMSAFMAQGGRLVVCGDTGEALGDSTTRPACTCAETSPDSELIASRRSFAPSTLKRLRVCLLERASTISIRASSVASARTASCTTSRSTTRSPPTAAQDIPDAQFPQNYGLPLPGGLRESILVRPQRDMGDPAGGSRGDLQRPWIWRETTAAPLR